MLVLERTFVYHAGVEVRGLAGLSPRRRLRAEAEPLSSHPGIPGTGCGKERACDE